MILIEERLNNSLKSHGVGSRSESEPGIEQLVKGLV